MLPELSGPVPAGPVRLTGPFQPPMLATALAGETVPLAHYLWLLRRHGLHLAAFTVAAGLVTLAIAWRLEPSYEAVATVEVDRQMLAAQLGPEAARMPAADTEQYLATQIRLVQSDSVVRPVALKYGLRERERPGEASAPSAPIALKRLRVQRPPSTYLLQISYRSPDPELAARVANEIADSYIAHSYRTRVRASDAQSTFLSVQLTDLEGQMRRSSEALARFSERLQLVSPEQKGSILAARLLKLNEELTAAQAARVREEAAWQSVRSGSVAAAQNAVQADSLRRLADHANELRERFAEIEAQYGPNHPEYRRARLRLEEVERQTARMRATIAARVETGFLEAADRERMLAAAVASAKQEFDQLQSQGFAYQSLQRAAEADRRLYDDLVRKIREAGINANLAGSGLRIADPARPPARPVAPRVGWITGWVVLGSLAAGLTLMLVADAADGSVRDPEQVERAWGVAVLGSLPVVNRWRRELGRPGGRAAAGLALAGFTEALRTLRSSMLLTHGDHRLKSVLVTSPAPGEGKSTIAAHLAAIHAGQGRRTLLIDADLRKPGVHQRFDVPATEGLGGVIAAGTAWRAALVSPPECPGLAILTAGAAGRTPGDLATPALARILAEAAGEFDWILIDAPPLLGFPEPLEIAALVDGVLIAVRAGATPLGQLGAAVGTLARVRARTLGVVLNQVDTRLSPSYAHYGVYRHYGLPAPAA